MDVLLSERGMAPEWVHQSGVANMYANPIYVTSYKDTHPFLKKSGGRQTTHSNATRSSKNSAGADFIWIKRRFNAYR